MTVSRDTLYILEPTFSNPAYPGEVFYCEECVLMKGMLSAFPELAEKLDVVSVAWPRPRQVIVDLLGEENQSLPVLVLADDAPADLVCKNHNGVWFENDKDAILELLSRRHGLPRAHP